MQYAKHNHSTELSNSALTCNLNWQPVKVTTIMFTTNIFL